MLRVDGEWEATISGLVAKLYCGGNSSVLQNILYMFYLFLSEGLSEGVIVWLLPAQGWRPEQKSTQPPQVHFIHSDISAVAVSWNTPSQAHHGPQRLVGYVPALWYSSTLLEANRLFLWIL